RGCAVAGYPKAATSKVEALRQAPQTLPSVAQGFASSRRREWEPGRPVTAALQIRGRLAERVGQLGAAHPDRLAPCVKDLIEG
ncbi:MAG: hypothetical protein ACRDNF_19915, partial [Streptosporangiaceae bacterium]